MNTKEIRRKIDEIDRQIVKLIAQRSRFAHQECEENEVFQIQEIIEDMLKQRRHWAYEENINPDMIINIYSRIIK